MNKNGKLVMDEVIKGTLAVVVLIFIFGAIFFGLFGKTKASAEEKLPTAERLKNLLEKFTTTPGKAEFDRQEAQTTEIATIIRETINKMNDMDCIEQIDFSKVEDKDFVLKPIFNGDKTDLRIYKIVNGKEGYIFNYPFNGEIRVFENLDMIETIELKNFGDFIYKNKVNIIIFPSKNFNKELKNRPICSDGSYLYDITPEEVEDYNIIKVYQTEHINEQDLQDFKLFISTFTRDKEKRWVKENDISTSYNNQVMANTINTLRDKKFRIELI